MWRRDLLGPKHVGSSRIRDQTGVPCITRQSLNPWAPKKPHFNYLKVCNSVALCTRTAPWQPSLLSSSRSSSSRKGNPASDISPSLFSSPAAGNHGPVWGVLFGCNVAFWILVPRPGIEPVPSAAEAQSPNHCRICRIPRICFLFLCLSVCSGYFIEIESLHI